MGIDQSTGGGGGDGLQDGEDFDGEGQSSLSNILDIETESFATEKLNNAECASEHGSIQAAADAAGAGGTFAVDGGPDDLSDYPYDTFENGYLISSSVGVYSNQTAIFGPTEILLDDDVNEPMLVNNDPSSTNENVTIVQQGVVWNGNGANQTRQDEQDFWQENVGIYLENFENLTIEGAGKLVNANAWGIVPHDCQDFEISGWYFDQQDGGDGNQDGVHCVGPIEGGWVGHLRGTTQDDAVIADAGGDESDTSGTTQGDVKDLTFEDVKVRDGNHGGGKVLGNGDYTVENVTFRDCSFDKYPARGVSILSGSTDNPPSASQVTDITVDNVRTYSNDSPYGVIIKCPVGSLTVTNYEHTGNVESLIDAQDDVDLLKLSNSRITRAGKSGKQGTVLVANDGAQVHAHIQNVTGVNVSQGILIGGDTSGEITGFCSGLDLFNVEYRYGEDVEIDRRPSLKLSPDCPPATAEINGETGSTIVADSKWDPFDTGEDELATYLDGSWVQIS